MTTENEGASLNDNMLVFEAKSFYNAYIALEQLDRDNDHPLMLFHIPMIVNGAFAIEITFKAILTKNQIEYGKEHNLAVLFLKLPDHFQLEMMDTLSKKVPEYMDSRRLTEELVLLSTAFIDWRYAYEDHSAPAIDTRFLSAFSNAAISALLGHYNVELSPSTSFAKSEDEINKLFLENRQKFRGKNLNEIQKRLGEKKNQG